MAQTTKNGVQNQFNFDYQSQGGKPSRNAQQQNLSELALKDNVTGVVSGQGSGKNGTSNLTQLVSPSQTFHRTGSRQGNSYNRALSNGQI